MSNLPGVVVRRLSQADIPHHRKAMDVYSEAFDEPENYAHRPPSDAYLRDLLANPNFVQLAAFCGEQKMLLGL